jgi:predicted ArsR family transcriptional regulator
MFLPGYKDLAKAGWIAVIEELKHAGQLPVPQLATRLGISYMAAKQHCEALCKLGYVARSRVPRRVVGRPEVFYRLTAKADLIFPQAGVAFSLELLEGLRALFGESAPERLLYQYFQRLQERWQPRLAKAKSLVERATLLAGLREQTGCFCRCQYDPKKGFRIEEYHHPLAPLFAAYPRAAGMELRLLEGLLGTRVTRREIAGGPHGPARVDYEVATLGESAKH